VVAVLKGAQHLDDVVFPAGIRPRQLAKDDDFSLSGLEHDIVGTDHLRSQFSPSGPSPSICLLASSERPILFPGRAQLFIHYDEMKNCNKIY
jgi:hypothetical protein